MKKTELVPCCCCGQGMMHSGIPIFYRVTLYHMAVNMSAVQQESGLEQFFGGGEQGAALANVMGANPDIATAISSVEKLVCQPCFLEKPMALLIGD